MGGAVVSRLVIVSGGLLYPAYSSYKAVKGANVRQYVRWIMYWVVFALFTAIETFTDVFLSWLPFYYELKMIFVLWLATPYTKGSTYIYRKFIHPNLSRREQEIDLFLENARDKSYKTMVNVGSKGINMAANVVVTAAVKGQAVVTDKLKSYSVMDLTKLPDSADVHLHQPMPIGNPARVREMHQSRSNPTVVLDPADGSESEADQDPRLLSQFKAYSMMNLSQVTTEGLNQHIPDTSDDGEFTSDPPSYTIDDMRITRRSNFAEEAVPQPDDFSTQFYTMPRKKKSSKSKTKQLPPLPPDSGASLRRSKRKSKTKTRVQYDEISE
ncbi:receptor expression-enhancing protein 2-like [Ciona intestinalis]